MNNKVLRKLLLCMITIAMFALILNNRLSIGKETIETANTQSQSYFDNISLYGQQEQMQKLQLFEMEDKSYQVYMPSEMRTDVYVRFDSFFQLQIGDVIYHCGDPLTDIYKEGTYPMAARDENGNVLEEGEIKFYFSVFVPSVYIETANESMEAVNADKSIKTDADYAAINDLGELKASGRCTIKSRGNTSFGAEQKSYSINLDSEKELFGMEACSEWALLANYGNSTQQLKNKIVYDIAGIMEMPYTPESTYVNLYIDHQYNGLYLLTQKVSADGGSVKFTDEDVRSGISGPYLLEFDTRYKEEPVWFKTNRKSVVVKYPKTVQEEAYSCISECVNEVEKTLYSGNADDALKNIDINSWTSMYLLQEYFVQWDVEFASFFLYKYAADPLIYAGPVWDFDLAFGNMDPGNYPEIAKKTQWLKDSRGGWLGEMAKYPEFDAAFTQKYMEIFEPAVDEYLENRFDELVGSLVSASYMNAVRWNRGQPDIRVDAEEIRSWMLERKAFLKDFYKNKEAYHRVLFQCDWGSLSYYVKKGETLGALPIDENKEKREGYGIIIGWKEAEGNQITDETVITEDVVYYAIYQ